MAYCRCGVFGLVLGFLIMESIAQDAANENENSIEEEGAINNFYNGSVFSNASTTRLRNDVIEGTKPTVDTYVSTISGMNSTDFRDETPSFFGLNNTFNEHHETSRLVESELTSSADLDKEKSTTEFTTEGSTVVTNSSGITKLSRNFTELDNLLNVSTLEPPTTVPFNISGVNSFIEDITVTSSSTPFMKTTENKSTKFTEIGTAESTYSFSDSRSTDHAFPSTTDITSTSLQDVMSSSFEPNSNESNLSETNATTVIYEMMENTSDTSSPSVTFGVYSSSVERKTVSNLNEDTVTESNKLSTSTEPFVVDAQTSTMTSISTTSFATDESSSNHSLSPLPGTEKTDFSVFSSQSGETNAPFNSTESATSKMQDSSTNSFFFNVTSVSSDAELSSQVLNETNAPDVFGDTSLTNIVTDTPYNRITSTLEPFVSLKNGSDQTTLEGTVETFETVSTIDNITTSGDQTGTISELSLNVTDDNLYSTTSPFIVFNSTLESVETSTDASDSYNISREHSSWPTTDGSENVTETSTLTTYIIFNATSSPDNIMNSTGIDDSYNTTSYSTGTLNATGEGNYTMEELSNITTPESTESSITTISSSLSDFVSEHNGSVLTSTTSRPSTYDDAGFASTNTTDEFSTEQSTIESTSEASTSGTQSIPDYFSTTLKNTSSSEKNESSVNLPETTQEPTSTSYSETFSSTMSTIATPIDMAENVNKCLANLTEMEPENTVTVHLSPLNLQGETWNDSYEIRFQQSVLSCLNEQLANNGKSEEGYSSISLEDRKDHLGSSLRSRGIACVSSPSTSDGQAFYITFYVRQMTNGTETSLPASTIANSLKSCKWKIEQDVRLNITDIFENVQVATLPKKDDSSQQSILQRHATLFISLSLVFGLLLLFGTIVFAYFYCCRNSRHYDTEKKKLKDMSASMEIGDMVPANEILNGETGEKEMFGLVNGSSSHLIKMDDDGWVVPYSEIPLEEKNPPDVQDTKL